MYDLVGNPVDRFSYDVAQVITAHPIRIISFPWPQANESFFMLNSKCEIYPDDKLMLEYL